MERFPWACRVYGNGKPQCVAEKMALRRDIDRLPMTAECGDRKSFVCDWLPRDKVQVAETGDQIVEVAMDVGQTDGGRAADHVTVLYAGIASTAFIFLAAPASLARREHEDYLVPSSRRLKSLSKISRELLESGESQTADFKRSGDGISAEDFVAFANSEGGTILAGVDEIEAADGVQKGSVRGCDVSDGAILQILNKAVACIPPVAADIYIENTDDKAILRIVISSSATKPHCTPKGVYCVRDGTRNRPLHPNELLQIFLEAEAQTFSDRFEESANRLVGYMEEIESSLSSSIDNMSSQLGWAESKLDSTESYLSTIFSRSYRIEEHVDDINSRVRILFRQDNRDDPVRQEVAEKLRSEIAAQLLDDEALLDAALSGKKLQAQLQGKNAVELTQEEAQRVFQEGIELARKQRDEAAEAEGASDKD